VTSEEKIRLKVHAAEVFTQTPRSTGKTYSLAGTLRLKHC